MQKFTTLTSTVIPLPFEDIDTDMIIPAQHLTKTNKDGYGQFLFERLRQGDPNFPLNLQKYQDSKIILAKQNFGCGSSREHAVWSLLDWGIQVVIAPSFADIFTSNSSKNGLLNVVLPAKIIQKILDKPTVQTLQVDLSKQKVFWLQEDKSKASYPFDYDQFRKFCILKGQDDSDYILNYEAEIQDWHQNNPQFL